MYLLFPSQGYFFFFSVLIGLEPLIKESWTNSLNTKECKHRALKKTESNFLLLQMKQPRPKKVGSLAQGHTANARNYAHLIPIARCTHIHRGSFRLMQQALEGLVPQDEEFAESEAIPIVRFYPSGIR